MNINYIKYPTYIPELKIDRELQSNIRQHIHRIHIEQHDDDN